MHPLLCRLCCLAAALFALPAAAQAPSDAAVKGQSANASKAAAQRTPQVVKDASKLTTEKLMTEKLMSSQELARAARHNNSIVGLAGGQPEDSFSSYATDIANALDDGYDLRVLPIASYGAVGNVIDLLYLNSVDVAITYADVLDHFKRVEKIPNLEQRLHYVIPMFQGELHLLVRPEIKTIQDLAGKKVGFDALGSGASHTGAIVFERLGVNVDRMALSNSLALEAMRRSELAGIVHLASKPSQLLARLKPESGFHFLAIEYSDKFRDYYVPAEISSADYPNLVAPGRSIRTISVQALLAVYNWPPGSDRYRRCVRFVESLFDRFDRLRADPFQQGWREMNLAGTIPGWTRFAAAQEILDKAKALSAVDPALVRAQAIRTPHAKPAEQERSFEQFLQWTKQQKQ